MRDKIMYYTMPIFKVFLFLSFVIVCFFPTLIVLSFDFISFDEKSLITQVFYELGIALAVLGALLMIFRVLTNYDFESVFIKQKFLSGFLKGSLIGLILLLCCTGLAYLNGNVSFTLGEISIPLFLGYLVYYMIVACFEELLFRSFPLRVFSERYPAAIAIIISSLLFGLAHLGNESFNWLAMTNITLAGILFAVFILQKGNLSWAIGLHFGWNFTQGTLLGYQVSGNDSPGILLAKPLGESYLSGGDFGIESSIFCTIIMLIVIAFMLFKYKIEPIYENEISDESAETTTE
ncbi:MAG: CPBP family intramembrane metalloprotease [Sphingobacteriaceae bacterium]|nr:CPBP family intramembrane metalloprotease [Sphingobacteriaceae bacterium]